jgi:hypothetical protein
LRCALLQWYTEVQYTPGNSGSQRAREEFEAPLLAAQKILSFIASLSSELSKRRSKGGARTAQHNPQAQPPEGARRAGTYTRYF